MKHLNFTSGIIFVILTLFAINKSQSQTNQYLNFDGVNDYVAANNASTLVAGGNAMTITGWFKDPAPNYGHGLMGFRNSTTNFQFYLIELYTGQVECRIYSGGVQYTYTAPNNTVVANTWQHFALVWNGSTLTLYANGNIAISGNATGSLPSSMNEGFYIGFSPYPGETFYYPGNIDEVSLWNTALTQSEVQNMMTNELTGSEPGLKLYYKFNQGVPGGNNTSITTLHSEVNSPLYDGAITNFALTGTTSNFEGTAGPAVITTAATSVTQNSATLNGTVNANGNSTTTSFEYGLTTSYGSTDPGVPATVNGSIVTPVTDPVSGLLPGTIYHFRIVGSSSMGTVYGNDMTFTTPGAPTVVTNAATAITGTSATLNGTITANNLTTTPSFEYGLTTSYGSTVAGVPSSVTGSTATSVSGNISGLSPGIIYHYRAKGINSAGTNYGLDMTFTTPGPPTVVTNTPTNISPTSATINGNVTANGASTAVSFEWGPTTSYGSTISASPATVTGTAATAVSAILYGLSTNTTYHYRCKGVNSGGTNYGADQVIVLQGAGIDENSKGKFTIYPVPNDGQFIASISNTGDELFTITVYNDQGALVYEKKNIQVNNKAEEAIDIRPMSSGVYTVTFSNSRNNVVSRIVINK